MSKYLIAALTGAATLAPFALSEVQAETPKLSLDARYDSGVQNEDGGTTEIVAYNPHMHATYVVNGETKKVEAISLSYSKSEAMNIKPFLSLDIATILKDVDPNFTYGGLTSISVHPTENIIAVSVQSDHFNTAGYAVVLTGHGELIKAVPVGVQPDNITFTLDGNKLLTANEGEPREGYGLDVVDPVGSISVIDTSNGFTDLKAETITFEAFDTPEKRAELVNANVLLKKNTTPSVDLEPEYIAVNADSTKAYVALQENNAIATIDLTANEVISVRGLGFKDHQQPGNELDLYKNDEINIQNEPYFGIYMPDGIATVEINGKDYIVTANEGDGREWGDENSPNFHLNEIETEDETVKYDTSGYDGFIEGNEYIYGARSFAIFDADTMQLVFDSGSDFERITAEQFPEHFNASNTNIKLDSRSGKKGPEPEDVKVASIGDKVYAFIGLERIGGVMMYDITNPTEATFADYLNLREFTGDMAGDVSPEGMAVITKENKPQLLVGHEVSGTVTVLNVLEQKPPVIPTYTDLVNHPYKEAAEHVVGAGLFKGVSDTAFAPNKTFTKGQAAIVLYRLAGEPLVKDLAAFDDLTYDEIQRAVAFTAANKLLTATNEKTFGAADNLTREQFAIAVYELLKSQARIETNTAATFNDQSAISARGQEAVSSLKAAGVMIGDLANNFNPQQPLTRIEAAITLDRLLR